MILKSAGSSCNVPEVACTQGWWGVGAGEADIFSLHARARAKTLVAQPVFLALIRVDKGKMIPKPSRI